MTATPKTTIVRVPKAGEMVAAQLRRQIVTGELKAGDLLPPESALMEKFGVSSPTLREAFRILESEQVLQVRRGARGGAHVLVPDPAAAGRYAGTLLQYRGTTLADLHNARGMLESSAVEVLSKKRTAADLRALEEALADGENLLSDPIAYAGEHDLAFHRLLAELAGNQTLLVFLDMLFSIIARHNQSVINSHRGDDNAFPSVKATQRAHVKLVELLRDKDTDRAVSFWRRHLDLVSEYMLDSPGETVLDVLF